jgi:hypothetical protein
MRALKLHHPTGHAYWNADEYRIERPDGTFVDISHCFDHNGWGYRIKEHEDGIYLHLCACGSGYGKVEVDYKKPLVISAELQQSLNENLPNE